MRTPRFFLAALAATCLAATWIACGAIMTAPRAAATSPSTGSP